MKMRLLASVAALALSAAPMVAVAAPTMRVVWGAPTPATGPVLVNTAVNFGALTLAGKGGVGLASQDVSTYGFAFKGLDLWDGNVAHTPKKWTITDNGGSECAAGACFELDGTTSCKSTYTTPDDTLNPPTPRPCTFGTTHVVAGQSYTFTVTATDAVGNVSAPATLTYNMIANTANLGDQSSDSVSTSIPSGWKTGSMPSGATLALSTGANWIAKGGRMLFSSLDFTLGAAHAVTFTWADAARPGGLWEAEILGTKNFILNGLTFTGPGTSPSGYWIEINTTASNITLQDVAIIKTAAEVVNGDSSKGLSIFGSNVTVNNFRGRYLPTCIEWGKGASNVTFNNTWCRYIYVNFADTSSFTNVTLNDTYFISPMRYNAQHSDSLQLSNAINPNALTINRFMSVQADGDAVAQGPIFSGRPGTGIGYVDDTANGNPGLPGTTFTLMSLPSGAEQLGFTDVNMTLISATDSLGHVITPGTKTVTTCPKPTSGVPHPTCQFSGAPQLLGSAASPVQIWTTPTTDLQVNGAIYAGGSFVGFSNATSAGTSLFKNFSYVKSNGYNNGQDMAYAGVQGSLATYTSGATSWNILTASAAATGNQVGLFVLMRSSWDQVGGKPCNPNTTTNFPANCTSTGGGIGPPLTGGPATGTGGTNPTGLVLTGGHTGGAGVTYALDKTPIFGIVANKRFDFRFDFPLDGGPKFTMSSVDSTLLHSGTYDVSSGFMWDALFFTNVNGSSGSAPAGMTIANVTQGLLTANGYASTHAVADAAFKNGDPQAALDAIPTTTWRAMTDVQVIDTYVAALLPKTGGALDAGAGNWYAALTAAGLWNDGSGKTPGH